MENQNTPVDSNLLRYMSNPKSFTLKKWFSGILQERFSQHEPTIERVASSLVTDTDLAAFGKLMGDLFEIGYMKAVNDYRKELEKMGITISVGAEQTPTEINQ